MVNQNEQIFKQIVTKYRALMRKSPQAVGTIAINLFKESFTKQGQIMAGGSIKHWEPRGASPKNRKGRNLLIKSGALRRDITQSHTSNVVTIKSDLPYSKIQNDGGMVPVTIKMRKFFWAMFKQSGDEFWKGMALTKKTHFTIKSRPFMYDTPELPKRLDDYFIKQLNSFLK